MSSAWYGKSSTKQIQQLLETKPKLIQLANATDFIQQLKSYNTKLLEYITNNPSLVGQAIELITVSPTFNDTNQRKYKYPLQAIEIIETQTTCILNSFFKEVINSSSKGVYFDQLFNILEQKEILPILAGYFFRTNICLLNNRYKQTLDRAYLRPHNLSQLLNHSHLMPIVNTIQLYLNLDINKSSESDPNRLEIKKDLLNQIIKKIDQERKLKREDSAIIIQNLMTVLIETIEKYYLILDGKVLVEILTGKQCIQTMLAIIKQNWEGAYPAFNFFISLINYYSFSSFNSDDTDPEKKAKNLQRLQSQPMVIALRIFFSSALDKIMKTNNLTLYEYKLLEILCHCISISSEEILVVIKQTKFFGCLINLLFKHEHSNILHMLIEKSFLHVFISQRKIYDQYKRHLFCELDIIQLTASRVLRIYSEDKIFEQLKKKTYFGHFMRILKIYSGIQTTQQGIINSIKAKTEIWNKISTCLIKPYETICFKQLGSYQNIPEGKLQQFQVKRAAQQSSLPPPNPKPLSRSMIQEIRKEDQFLPSIKQSEKQLTLPPPLKSQLISEKKKQEQLLKAPTHNLAVQLKTQYSKPLEHRQVKKVESFKQFMSKKKVQAQKQIKLKRSLSHEKRLSGNKGKITNASPKKNGWTDKSENLSTVQKGSKPNTLKSNTSTSSVVSTSSKVGNQGPKIPMYIQKNANLSTNNANNNTSNSTPSGNNTNSPTLQFSSNSTPTSSGYRSYYGNSINQQQSSPIIKPEQKTSLEQQQENKSSNNVHNNDVNLSIKNDKELQAIKKLKVIQIETPKEKKYRRIEEKDKLLLDFLGITTGNMSK